MLQYLINVGLAPDDGTGDDLRSAFEKINAALQGIQLDDNANGQYLRLPNGFQVCWHSTTLAFVSADELSVGWTFPAAFIAAPAVLLLPAGTGTNINDTKRETMFVFASAITPTFASLRCRAIGKFGAGDSQGVNALAVGAWK